MRGRCARARASAPTLQDDDRLRGGATLECGKKAAAVAGAFDIGADHARVSVGRQQVEEIGFGQIERVAVAHDLAEAQAPRSAVQHQLDRVVTALRDERNIALFARQIGPERKARARVIHPHAVRADDPHPRLRRTRLDALLELGGPRVARLAEAAREQVQRGDALGRALGDQIEHAVRRYARDDEINIARHGRERRVRLEAGNLGRARVDRVDRPLEAEIDQRAHVVVARAIDVR